MTVAELKEELEAHGEGRTGNKACGCAPPAPAYGASIVRERLGS